MERLSIDLGGALLAALAALLGSWAGARSALDRYKQERAFDRRLQWYETAHRALAEARKQFYQLHHALGTNAPKDAVTPILGALSGTLERLADAMEDAVFYAPPATLSTLYALQGDMKIFSDGMSTAPASSAAELKVIGTFAQRLLVASRELAGDIRPQLGLKSLPPQFKKADA